MEEVLGKSLPGRTLSSFHCCFASMNHAFYALECSSFFLNGSFSIGCCISSFLKQLFRTQLVLLPVLFLLLSGMLLLLQLSLSPYIARSCRSVGCACFPTFAITHFPTILYPLIEILSRSASIYLDASVFLHLRRYCCVCHSPDKVCLVRSRGTRSSRLDEDGNAPQHHSLAP